MEKYFYGILLIFLSIACQNQANKKTTTRQSPAKDSISQTIVSKLDTAEIESLNQENTALDSIIDGYILMPVAYRVWEGDAVSKIINKQWLEIHRKNGAYYITPASYTIEFNDEEPCSGLPTETIVPKENVLVFLNLPNIRKGKVDSVAFTNKIVEPKKPFDFSFKNQPYRLIASGIQFYKDENRNNPNAKYILKLYKDNEYVKTLIHQTSYNDTATEIEFIGDLDGDGEPDFIFSSPRDYEEMRMIIILSGSSSTYEGSMQFDC